MTEGKDSLEELSLAEAHVNIIHAWNKCEYTFLNSWGEIRAVVCIGTLIYVMSKLSACR